MFASRAHHAPTAVVGAVRHSCPVLRRSSGGELSPSLLTRILPHPSEGGAARLNAAPHSADNDSAPWVARLLHALLRTCQALTWRRAATVLILCLILSTQILAQPD